MSDSIDFEQLLDWLVLLDSARARATIFVITALSVIGLSIYATLLQFVCLVKDDVLAGILLVLIQTPVGLFITRKYFDIGTTIRENTTLIEPMNLGSRWKTKEVEVTLGGLQRIFETFQILVEPSGNENADDLSDISWFVIVVVSAVTLFITVSVGCLQSVCVAIAVIQVLLALLLLIHGYRSRNLQFLADAMLQLEYQVFQKTNAIQSVNRDQDLQILLRLKSWWKMLVLWDIVIRISSTTDHFELVIEYHFGLSASESERIVLRKMEGMTIECLSDLLLIREHGWRIDSDTNGNIVIRNPNQYLSLGTPFSWLSSPEAIHKVASALQNDISCILERCLRS